jgi:ABC-type uncharacterized transport system substrate-binding protein
MTGKQCRVRKERFPSMGSATYLMVGAMLLLMVFGGAACNSSTPPPDPGQATEPQPDYTGKKVLFVDSYHEGYEWSDGIEKGLQDVLKDTGVELKIIRMDTKRNPSVEFAENAGTAARAEIEAFKPDVLIAADDNAQKYVVVPYFVNTSLPVVFCGVNWDASIYDYPTSNVTGMIEVELPDRLIEHLKTYAKGDKIGYLTVDSETERKVAAIYNERFFSGAMKEYWVTTWDEYQETFIQAQEEVDILFLGNNAGIDRWEEDEAKQFITENTRIPTGSINDWLAPYGLITLAKSPEEQGEWAAQAALRILDGTPVSKIAVVENKREVLILNLDIAGKLGVVFPPSMLRNAEIYGSAEEANR